MWLPNHDSPGLAMARAFGDFCLKDYGLISVPDINYRRLTERDHFIILATDGVHCSSYSSSCEVLSESMVAKMAKIPVCAIVGMGCFVEQRSC